MVKKTKKLVVFYSRTGTTRKLAQAISKQLLCDFEEIQDSKDRTGPVGYLKSGIEASKRKLTKIKPLRIEPKNYDIVIIGTPVWAWNISVPIRTYLTENSKKFKNVAFFCTQGGSGQEQTFEEMQKICGKKPKSTLACMTKEVHQEKYKDKLAEFVKPLK